MSEAMLIALIGIGFIATILLLLGLMYAIAFVVCFVLHKRHEHKHSKAWQRAEKEISNVLLAQN
jgi:hypothetical protein